MITLNFSLCALPRLLWEKEEIWGGYNIAINKIVEDVLSIERRLKRDVNVENEHTRYNLCCARIEAGIPRKLLTSFSNEAEFSSVLQAQQLSSVTLDKTYFDDLLILSKQRIANINMQRMGSSIFPPNTLKDHIAEFAQLATMAGISDKPTVQQRAKFFHLAHKYDCGVIELRNFFIYKESAETPVDVQILGEKETIYPLHEQTYTNEDDLSDASQNSLYSILNAHIQRAIETSRQGQSLGEVNFSNQPHNVITEVLNAFIYKENLAASEPTYIRVVYTDGSQGAPFPLLCLPRRNKRNLASFNYQLEELRVAMMSMRHQEMDADVDIAWFRNREVSKSRSLGESDDFCYTQSKKQFQNVFTEGKFRIILYHTGFQPAILGFYRALVEKLLERSNDEPLLEVVPYYYRRNKGYEPGNAWY